LQKLYSSYQFMLSTYCINPVVIQEQWSEKNCPQVNA